MRILGLDVGQKTIGVAVSDELRLCAHAVKTLARRGTKGDVEQVLALCSQYQTREAVVGLPLKPEGDELLEGQRARRVRVFGDALAAAGLTIHYHDESYSTVAATEVLLEADLSRARRKQVVDRLAAAVILQAYLDSAQRSGAPSIDSAQRSEAPSIDSAQRSGAPSIDDMRSAEARTEEPTR